MRRHPHTDVYFWFGDIRGSRCCWSVNHSEGRGNAQTRITSLYSDGNAANMTKILYFTDYCSFSWLVVFQSTFYCIMMCSDDEWSTPAVWDGSSLLSSDDATAESDVPLYRSDDDETYVTLSLSLSHTHTHTHTHTAAVFRWWRERETEARVFRIRHTHTHTHTRKIDFGNVRLVLVFLVRLAAVELSDASLLQR